MPALDESRGVIVSPPMANSERQKPTRNAQEARDKAESPPEPPADSKTTPYTALARKYRPRTFDGLIGQEAMVQTLRNAFATGRIAHAYMLTGVRGVGKTTTARLIARALNYETETGKGGPTLDMQSSGIHCQAILESRHIDVIEMDAASHTGIDDVRDIIDSAHYNPATARYKVYIVDEVHMLSKQAFNGLLKTLEEPPPHVKFIFATTEIRKVPVTVLSRCQRFDLRRVDIDRLTEHLRSIAEQEGAEAEDEALALIARAAEGSVRDSLSVLDRAIAHGSGTVKASDIRALLGLADRTRIFDLLETVLAGQAGEALTALAALDRDGAEPAQVIVDLAEAVHAITRIKAAGKDVVDASLSEAERLRAAELAERLSMPVLARAWQMLLKGYDEVKGSPRPLAAADMILVRLAYAADLPPPGELMRQLKEGKENSAQPARTKLDREPASTSSLRDFMPAQPVRRPARDEAYNETDSEPKSEPKSFEDIVQLVEAKRDLKLKNALCEQVRLVRFRPGDIELNALSGAPRDLAPELTRKLQEWTGRRWMVALSAEEGEPPLGAQRREREAREIERVRDHPAVKEVLHYFPEAQIDVVRPTESGEQDEDEPLNEDRTG
jgi:DNA polymerase III subunit gamma/tau